MDNPTHDEPLVTSSAWTTAIVSGKYTMDGRPLLFKHRDSGKLQNKIMYFIHIVNLLGCASYPVFVSLCTYIALTDGAGRA